MTSAFEFVQKFLRKRENVSQILFDFDAPFEFGAPPNTAGVHCMRCATRMMSAKVVAESALHLLPRLRDFGVRKRAKFRANAWQILVGFGAPPMKNSASVHRVRCATRLMSAKVL